MPRVDAEFQERKRIVFSFARAAVLEAHGQADAHGAFLSPHANLGLTDEEFAEIAEQASERAAEIVAAKLDVIREIARHLERTNGVAGGASLSLLLRANEGNRDAALILLNFAPRVGADVDHLWRQSRRGGESFDTWYERNHRDLMVICSPRQAN